MRIVLNLYSILFLCWGILPCALQAQSDTIYIIQTILIQGNDKTKASIIERELDVKVGDRLPPNLLKESIRKSEQRIFNTGLFLDVLIQFQSDSSYHTTLIVQVKERWYTFIVPLIGLADRNFTEWWVERNRDLSRLELGAYWVQKNMRGRNETLKVRGEFGFVKKAEITYTIPYIDRKKKMGIQFYTGWIANRQIPLETIDNKLFYFEDEATRQLARIRRSIAFTFIYRNNFYTQHQWGVNYTLNTIRDTIAERNPRYFLDTLDKQSFVGLKYSFIVDKRDIQFYATKGHLIRLDIENMGLGLSNSLNMTFFKGELTGFQQWSKRIFTAYSIRAKYSLPLSQPYFNQRGLGYEKDAISGYELFVIDGQHFLLQKIQWKLQLLNLKKTIATIPDKRFSTIPLQLWVKAYVDMGYVWDYSGIAGNKALANQYLAGGGVGVDIVSFYDFVCRFEYSINRQGDTGFYINFKAAI